MLQGTASDVGKSVLAAAFCRIFVQDGLRTVPFKSQNMSLNSYLTPDGKEIGAAQGMQADACGIAASTDMNPILLKPVGEMTSQVIVHGKLYKKLSAKDYRERYLEVAQQIVVESLNRLRAQYDQVVIEGAGSPAEINLKDRDIVNMRLAAWADAPVILVADIDRGGVFASIVGTLEILTPEERARVKGFIINKFRGDVRLLQPGLDWLKEKTGKPVLGVVPFLPSLNLEDEDSASLDRKLEQSYRVRQSADLAASGIDAVNAGNAASQEEANDSLGIDRSTCEPGKPDQLDIAVIRLPRLANFADLDALAREPDVKLRYVDRALAWGAPDAVILPDTNNMADDFQFLKETGLAGLIKQQADQSGQNSESPLGSEAGSVRGALIGIGGGCRMLTQLGIQVRVFDEGSLLEPALIAGTEDNRLFQQDSFRRQWLNLIRAAKGWVPLAEQTNYRAMRELAFDRLAAHVRKHVRMDQIEQIMREHFGVSNRIHKM